METAQLWDVIKLVIVAYVAFVMNKNDRDHRESQAQNTKLFEELFKRVTEREIECASNHGRHLHSRAGDK